MKNLEDNFATAHRLCAHLDLHDAIDGHMSWADPKAAGEFLLSPYPLHWSEVTADSVLRVRLKDGRVLSHNISELDAPAWSLHSALQEFHSRHSCFIHAHPPYATALTCRQNGRLLPIHQNCVPILSDISYFDEYEGELTDQSLGTNVAEAMGRSSHIFLKSHGVITAGRDPAHALKRLYYLERACRYQILAEAAGEQLSDLSGLIPHEANNMPDLPEESHATKLFSAWRRVFDAKKGSE